MPKGKAAIKAKKPSHVSSRAAHPAVRHVGRPKKSASSSQASSQSLPPPPAPPIITPVDAVSPIPPLAFNPDAVTSYAELVAALTAKTVQITLAGTIIATGNILINYDVAINFNGYSIISEETFADARVLDIRSGEVTLTGNGKIFAMGPRSVAIRLFGAISSGVPHYTTLTIDEGISLFAPDSYGILISPNLGAAYGLTLNCAGKVTARDGICLASGVNGRDANFPLINIKNTARIIADETYGAAIEASGYGQWELSSATLSGAIGAKLTSGILHCDHTRIFAGGDGLAAFQIEPSEPDSLEVSLNGGTYLSEHGFVIDGLPGAIKSFTISDADLCSPQESIISESAQDCIEDDDANFYTNVDDILNQLKPKSEFTLDSPEVTTEPTSIATPAPSLAELSHVTVLELSSAELTPTAHEPTILPKFPTQPLSTLNPTVSATSEPTPSVVSIPAPLHSVAPVIAHAEYPQPTLPTSPPDPEVTAARSALEEALMEILKLKAEDYDVGFADLQRAISGAQRVLSHSTPDLAKIRDAAGELLQAFDNLEERSDLSLSDEELDDLFYHGAVLSELSSSDPIKKKDKKSKKPKSKPLSTELAVPQPDYEEVPLAPSESTTEPDFTILSEALDTIAGLDLNKYTPESQELLLRELARARNILTDLHSTQSAIDEIASSLLVSMGNLEFVKPVHATIPHNVKLTAPAPTVSKILPATMIDEMTPSDIWATGTTMIDEMTPFITDQETMEWMFRSVQPHLTALIDTIASPFRRLLQSLAAGARAGLNAYREALHSAKN